MGLDLLKKIAKKTPIGAAITAGQNWVQSGVKQPTQATPQTPAISPDRIVIGRNEDGPIYGDRPATASPAPPPDPTQAAAPTITPEDAAAMKQTRDQQQRSIANLEAAAAGTTPSVAEQQLVAAMNRASQQRLGVAAQSRGADQLAMQREAQIGIGQDALSAGAEAGAARAAEMTGARGALAAATGGARGQDIGFATGMATLRADTESGNADRVVTTAGQLLSRYGMDLTAELTRRGQDAQFREAARNRDWNTINAIIQGIVTVAPLALAASDERIKSDVSAVPDDELGNFANKVAESIFSYERKGSPQREAGTMAQDVAAAGPLGAQVTGEVSPGTMGVDYGRLATLMAAAALRNTKNRV